MATDQNYEKQISSNNKNSVEKNLKKEEQNAFTLLLRISTNIIIAPKGIQQIGISFAPDRLGEYTASVQVRSGDYWRNYCLIINNFFDDLSFQDLYPTCSNICKLNDMFSSNFFTFYYKFTMNSPSIIIRTIFALLHSTL